MVEGGGPGRGSRTGCRTWPRVADLVEGQGLWSDRSGVLSTQVLREFYVVATRKFQPPMNRAEARELVGLYETWPVVRVDVEMILDAAALEERAQLFFWDALIV